MRSLVREINVAIVATLLVVSLLFGTGFFAYQLRQRRHFLEERLFLLKTFKKGEERTLVDPLFEGKPETLRLELQRLGRTEGMEAIGVFDRSGKKMADFPDGSLAEDLGPAFLQKIRAEVGGNAEEVRWKGHAALRYGAPLDAVGETIGFLQIVYSSEDIVRQQRSSLWFFFLLLASLLAASLTLLNLLMSRLVISPIKSLVQTVEEIERGNLAVRSLPSREDEIGRLSRSFNEMVGTLGKSFAEIEKQNVDLKELDRLKNEFLANVSHEIRTPLHAIIGFSEGMLEGEANVDRKKYIETILESGRNLNQLVGSLLDFSQIKAGKVTLDREPVPVRKAVESVLPQVRSLLGRKPVELAVEIPSGLPPVLGDLNRVQQIFLNLLGNAAKFTEQGRIVFAARQKGEGVECIVSDTGIGFSPEAVRYIFDEFRQGDGSTRRKYGGAGLGLTIARHLVALHGGELVCESREGEGSTFRFTLPKA